MLWRVSLRGACEGRCEGLVLKGACEGWLILLVSERKVRAYKYVEVGLSVRERPKTYLLVAVGCTLKALWMGAGGAAVML